MIYLSTLYDKLDQKRMGFFSFFRSKSIDLRKPFPKDQCTSLVIYAAKTLDDNPDKTFPSFISHDFDPKTSALTSDIAPYLSAVDATDMEAQIRKWKDNSFDKADYKIARQAEIWVNKKVNEGWSCFMYELEPAEFAGESYEWARRAK